MKSSLNPYPSSPPNKVLAPFFFFCLNKYVCFRPMIGTKGYFLFLDFKISFLQEWDEIKLVVRMRDSYSFSPEKYLRIRCRKI